MRFLLTLTKLPHVRKNMTKNKRYVIFYRKKYKRVIIHFTRIIRTLRITRNVNCKLVEISSMLFLLFRLNGLPVS